MTNTETTIPQQLFGVTLGARDIAGQRAFYESWGWKAAGYSTAEYVAFDVGGLMLAFYPTNLLAQEAAPNEQYTNDGWNRTTLAVNLPARESVDQVWRNAVASGAKAVGEPEDRPWGGRSGYIADPEGNRWEISWVPQAIMESA